MHDFSVQSAQKQAPCVHDGRRLVGARTLPRAGGPRPSPALESANRRIENADFVERGIASVVAIGTGDRQQAEMGLVGPEGMPGLAIVLGVERSPHDTFMQVDGTGQSITADNLRRAMAESPSLASYLLRYAHVFSIQAGHTALANAQGKVEKRLARWLLMAHDRLEDDKLL